MKLAKDAHTSAEHHFIECLFMHFRQAGVTYAVMRNYEALPHSAGGSDLDILVHPDDEGRARAIITEAIRKAGGVAIGYVNNVGFLKVFTLGLVESGTKKWWGLRLDISFGLRYAGIADLVEKEILRDRYFLHNGIRVLRNDIANVLGVVKELLHNKTLPARYRAVAEKAVKENWEELRVALAPMGEPALALLRELCLLTPESSDIEAKSLDFRRTLLRTAFLRGPLTYLRFRFLYEWSKVHRFMNPPGIVIAVLGVDGVGKSTIISAIEPALSAATHGAFIVKHLRPGLLPPLARLMGKQAPQEGPVTEPHGSQPSGGIGSLLRVFYLMADYVFGYWLVVRPKIAKSPAIVLFDRYAYDMALDQRRFRIGLPGGLVRWFTRFAPKPDIIICLHGDPVVIAARKQELTLEEVQRQTKALMEFARYEPRAVLVSNDLKVRHAQHKVLRTFADFCADRENI